MGDMIGKQADEPLKPTFHTASVIEMIHPNKLEPPWPQDPKLIMTSHNYAGFWPWRDVGSIGCASFARSLYITRCCADFEYRGTINIK